MLMQSADDKRQSAVGHLNQHEVAGAQTGIEGDFLFTHETRYNPRSPQRGVGGWRR